MNVFETFYTWLTYNPTNIPVTEILMPGISLFIITAVVIFLVSYAFIRKFSVKLVIWSLFASLYTLIVLCWGLCFLSANIFVQMVPLYPLVVILLMLLVRKRMKARKGNYPRFVVQDKISEKDLELERFQQPVLDKLSGAGYGVKVMDDLYMDIPCLLKDNNYPLELYHLVDDKPALVRTFYKWEEVAEFANEL